VSRLDNYWWGVFGSQGEHCFPKCDLLIFVMEITCIFLEARVSFKTICLGATTPCPLQLRILLGFKLAGNSVKKIFLVPSKGASAKNNYNKLETYFQLQSEFGLV
jgi:hypothetical protein